MSSPPTTEQSFALMAVALTLAALAVSLWAWVRSRREPLSLG
jgi:hypothetical protein